MSSLSQAIRARNRILYSDLVLTLSAGLSTGVGASSIFVVLLTALAVHDRFPTLAAPNWMLISTTIAVAFIPAVIYGVLVASAREERAVWWRTLSIGALLPLVGFAGLFSVAARLEPLATTRPELTLAVFRVAFVGASAIVAFICTLVAMWLFRVPASVRRALTVAAVTAAVYLLVALALDPVPGFHVGGGDRAMPKVAALSNLIAGMAGGTLAFRGLTHRSPKRG